MNIFATHPLPKRAARDLDDKRVVKMVLETAQILSTVMHKHGEEGFYRPTHRNHPVVIWAAERGENYSWVVDYFQDIADEYSFRYGRTHASAKFIPLCRDFRKKLSYYGERAHFVQCMPEAFRRKTPQFAMLAYQDYLNHKWRMDVRRPNWTHRAPPRWANF